jgi:hypothetical protein
VPAQRCAVSGHLSPELRHVTGELTTPLPYSTISVPFSALLCLSRHSIVKPSNLEPMRARPDQNRPDHTRRDGRPLDDKWFPWSLTLNPHATLNFPSASLSLLFLPGTSSHAAESGLPRPAVLLFLDIPGFPMWAFHHNAALTGSGHWALGMTSIHLHTLLLCGLWIRASREIGLF